ncbi:MAG: adenine deaminase, partial [Deltaproteobacteria bacterium]|nr:adenine deaminase [Deltaproteobacteria bacterium]
VMIRNGFVRRELGALSGLADNGVDLANVMMVTDIADPEELVTRGGMNLLLKEAVALGFDPVQAVQMVTINVARYFGLNDLGGIAPGRTGDIVVVDDLHDFHCHQVWADGRLVAKEERLCVELPSHPYPEASRRSIRMEKVASDVFRIPFSGARTRVRVEEIVNETITRELTCDLTPRGGFLEPDPGEDILKAAVFRKDSRDPRPGLGFARGVGLRSGALATSLIWDTNNILAIGASDEEMAFAVNRLIDLGGGMIVVQGEDVLAELPLPLCGITSPKPLPDIVRDINAVEGACHKLGCRIPRPFLTLQTFCFTGLPFFRLTDKGLADIRKRMIVPLVLPDHTG